MSTLLRSQIECPECHEVIASLTRHDFNSCGCGAVAIDGGRDYTRVVCKGKLPEDRSIVVEEDLNNQEARIVMQALKDIAADEGEFPQWALKLLERNDLIRRNGEDWFDYIGPRLADR